jgi:hypothetical protein
MNDYMLLQPCDLKPITRITLLCALGCAVLAIVTIQPGAVACAQQGSRTIVSDDFTRNRQETPSTGSLGKGAKGGTPSAAATARVPQRTYKLASKPPAKPRPASGTSVVSQIGITLWRLRRVTGNVTGARVLVRENGKSSSWIAERVAADTAFRLGDYVRLSVESPRDGYLYVIDRELYSNGSTGPAMLIYPWSDMRGADNRMLPGKLVDIPAQEDDPSYFTAKPSSPDQVGEILTVIITTSPLNLPVSDKPIEISRADIASWEKMWGGDSDRFEMEGGEGETWSVQEQQAATGKGSRQLTRDDPAPQTIYRIFSADNKATLVNVHLRYGK